MPPERPEGAGAFPKPVERAAPLNPDPAALYAALELGMNSCRMLIGSGFGNKRAVVARLDAAHGPGFKNLPE